MNGTIVCAEKTLNIKQCGANYIKKKILGVVYYRPVVGEDELEEDTSGLCDSHINVSRKNN